MVYPLVTGTFGERDAIHSYALQTHTFCAITITNGVSHVRSLLGEVADYLSQSSLTAVNERIQAATVRQQTNNAIRQSGAPKVGELASIQSLLANITAETERRAAAASSASLSLTTPLRHPLGLLDRRRSLFDYGERRRADRARRALAARELSSLHQHLTSLHQHLNQMISNATPSGDPKQMASDEMHKAIKKLTSLQTNVEAKLMEGTKHVVDGLVHVRDSLESLRDNLSVYVSCCLFVCSACLRAQDLMLRWVLQ